MGFMDELKLFVIVSMLLPIAFCTPIEQEQTNGMVDEPEPLSRRGAENMTPLEQYARDKYEEYVSESGKFRYGVDEPTNVWFLPDKGELYFLSCRLLLFWFIMLFPLVVSFPSQMLPKDISEPNHRGPLSVQHTHNMSSSGVLWLVRTHHSASGAEF
jgi:hypothetical protein